MNATVVDDGRAATHVIHQIAVVDPLTPTAKPHWVQWANVSSSLSIMMKGGLLPRQQYLLRSMAVNQAGWSNWSVTLTIETGFVSPPSPPIEVTTNSTGGAVLIAWQPPVDTGGVDISGYTLVFDSVQHQLTRHARSKLVPKLQAGTAYTFNITAVNVAGGRNGIGEPTPSQVVATLANVTLPDAPQRLGYVRGGFASRCVLLMYLRCHFSALAKRA